MLRCGRVEFGQRRQSVFGELAGLKPANRGNKGPCRHGLRTFADYRLRLADRKCRLDGARFVARPAADELHVKVVVDHPRNNGVTAKVDRVRTAARSARSVAQFHESSIRDAYFRHNRPIGVHRVNSPVGQQQQSSAGTSLRLSWSRAQEEHAQECW
jgi:hypothetical protein